MKEEIRPEQDMELWREDIEEYLMGYLTSVSDIPYLTFKENWLIRFVPNPSWHSDYIKVRFIVKLKDSITNDYLSVVLLSNDTWEVQNYDDEIFRCNVDDVERLYEIIEENL